MSLTGPTGGLETFTQFAISTALMKWLWASTNPGIIVRPPRSTSRVPAPRHAFNTASRAPTATTFPPSVATASAVEPAGPTVTITPPE